MVKSLEKDGPMKKKKDWLERAAVDGVGVDWLLRHDGLDFLPTAGSGGRECRQVHSGFERAAPRTDFNRQIKPPNCLVYKRQSSSRWLRAVGTEKMSPTQNRPIESGVNGLNQLGTSRIVVYILSNNWFLRKNFYLMFYYIYLT